MKKTISILILLSTLACKKQVENKVEKVKKKPAPEMTIKISHKTPKTINSAIAKEVKDWKEYKELEEYMNRFKKCSPNEALSYANEFKKIVRIFKNRKIIEELNNSAFKARVSVLHNEALRLYDMTLIPSITAKEVNTEVTKICTIYSNLNTKINTVFKQNKFNKEIDLDNFFELDKIKLKTALKNQEEKLMI